MNIGIKMKIKFYTHTVWNECKQLALIPTIFVTTTKYDINRFTVISISFLMWDLGISFYKEV